MNREVYRPTEQNTRPSFIRQLWHMTRFIKSSESLSHNTFWDGLEMDDKSIFNGSIDQIMHHQAVPVLVCANDEMQKNNLSKCLLALAMQQGVRLIPIVVDNASTDGTGDFAKKTGAIVKLEPKKGLINAIETGFTFLRDKGYRGPILHTDADSVPLPFWAETLVNYANINLSQGGEAFGSVFYYEGDENLLSPKNSMHTALAKGRDVTHNMFGQTPVPRGYNGIIMTGSGSEILDALSRVKSHRDTEKGVDVAVETSVQEAGGMIARCSDSNATVITSGRRVKNIVEMGLRIVTPKVANRRAYKGWGGELAKTF